MLKVIVVDDYPLMGRTIEYLLQKHRPEVQYLGQALSGTAGLDLALQCEPDVAFVDIKMPGMDGLELTEQLRMKSPQIKVVIVSAADDFAIVQSALRLRTCDYLLKPMKSEELLRIIDTLIEEKSIRIAESSATDSSHGDSSAMNKLGEQLLLQIQTGQTEKSSQEFDHFWTQLLTESQKNPSIMRIHVKTLVNAMQQSIELQSCSLDNTRKEVVEYACKTLVNGLSATDTPAKIKESTLIFIESCTNVYNENLFESGYSQIVRAKEIIEENIHQTITLDFIAQSIFISPFYLSRLFKKRTGTNFSDYVIERKIERAKTLLLTTNTTIESISANVGYDEPNSFRRLFKKRVGISPNEYRRVSRRT